MNETVSKAGVDRMDANVEKHPFRRHEAYDPNGIVQRRSPGLHTECLSHSVGNKVAQDSEGPRRDVIDGG